MRLAARRFPDTVTRRRTGADTVNDYGEVEPGPVTETELRASVQPISTEDLDVVDGSRLIERLTIYVPEAGALRAARDDTGTADAVVVDGTEYVIERSSSWRGHHTKAIALRELR